MNARALLVAGWASMAVALSAQTPASPSFDVASIKPNKTNDNQYGVQFDPGGRLRAINVTLATLIRLANGDANMALPPNRLVVNASWMGEPGDNFSKGERFDVLAKADGDPSDDQFRQMLRALLADRFKLVVHEELRELTTYHLVTSRRSQGTPPRLHPTNECGPDFDKATAKPSTVDTEPCSGRFFPGRIALRGATLAMLAQMLTAATDDHRAVEDRTGLSERFDLELEWRPDVVGSAAAADTAGPSLFTAIEEQLGLVLEPHKDRVIVLVVDRAELPGPD